MTLCELADKINKNIIITYYPNQGKRFSAHLENCEIKHGWILEGAYGNGKSPEEAINDYTNKIAGQILVIDAMDKQNRREIFIN